MKMKNSNTKFVGRWWVLAAVLIGAGFLNASHSYGEDAKLAPPAAAEKADASAKSATTATTPDAPKDAAKNETAAAEKSSEKAAAPAAKATETAPAAPAIKAAPESAAAAAKDEKAASKDAAKSAEKSQSKDATTAAPGAALVDEQSKSGWSSWVLALAILALFVLPIMAGNYLAKIWRMPDHAWKMSLMIGTAAASILICYFGEIKKGPDLAGGITLIYELDPTSTIVQQTAPQGGGQPNAGQIKTGAREFTLDKLIQALKQRLDPDGTKEITIRGYGQTALEIIVPDVGQDELDSVKRRIKDVGQLEFRITADPAMTKDHDIIELAKRTPSTQTDVKHGDTKVAEWVPYDTTDKSFGPVDRTDGYVKRLAGDTPQILVLMDPYNVTGEYLSKAIKGPDETGVGPAVHFSFNAQGAQRFGSLTNANKPNPATPDVYRHLGVILDKVLKNAPVIKSKIEGEGTVSGGSMSDKEVDDLVQILNAGSLPAALNKTPISYAVISPTLGGVTVQKGKEAIVASLIAVVLFMVIYYRFSGVVASIGLALNLIMVLAVMILIKGAFTLPGLAGLALTVGMSVDTNVLIYERIREELESGAALRMAIRNGFGRAMVAIIDTHLTTIISGIVLFSVGTDQVKGFAVTLILGLLVNLFTAFFCTRVMFDVAERRGYIKQLKMMHLFQKPNLDFLSIRWVALGASWVLIIIGMISVYFRGSTLLDIDFTGGSSVSFTLNQRVDLTTVHDMLVKTELGDKNLLVVERNKTDTEYTIDTSDQSVEAVEKVIADTFGNKLKKYTFEYTDIKPIKEGDFTGIEAKLLINADPSYKDESGVAHDALRDQIVAQLATNKHTGIQPILTNTEYRRGSNLRFKEWTVRIAGLDETSARAVLDPLQTTMRNAPIFPLASKIGGRVSGDMQIKALEAIMISLVAMVIYLWLRFSKPAYGIAAGVALIHDVLITIGAIAVSSYIVQAVPGLAMALQIDAFQINLTIVAALLTIIGFSVNDTIVTFDRLREIKGKSPNLTAKMVNDAVNQTLSRTILTVFTVFIVVVILYFFGGEGLHSFAFAFLVGIVTGTYSSVYIASPVVLWLSGVSAAPVKDTPPENVRGMQPAR
jgi:SecD/SecF fusion protein